MKKTIIVMGMIALSFFVKAQTTDDVLNLLIQKGAITQMEADSLRADYAVKQQEVKAKQKNFPLNLGRALQLSGYTQLRYQDLEEAGKIDGFDIRRARLDLRGNINPFWEYRLQTEFATSPKILDAYAAFKPYDFLKVTIGQFKIPFSMENIASSNKMESIDRSQMVEALVARGKDVIGNQNGRDIGIQASGSVLKIKERYIIDYYLGYFNGAGTNVVADNNEAKDVIGRIVFHPAKMIDIGGSYCDAYDQWGSPITNKVRSRIGGELSFNYKKLSVKGEYITGQDGEVADTAKKKELHPLNKAGYYVQASYFIFPKKLQIVVKYDVYDPNTFNDALVKSSDTDISSYYIFGLNYFFNDWAKIQLSTSFREEQKTQIRNDLLNIQFQIGF